MATFTKTLLSNSTQGKGILIAATTSVGTTIHTTTSSSATLDEIWLYAYNSSSSSIYLTIQYGGTISPNNDIKIVIPAQQGLTLAVPGLILSGDGSTGATIAAYATLANVITISGYVNRIS